MQACRETGAVTGAGAENLDPAPPPPAPISPHPLITRPRHGTVAPDRSPSARQRCPVTGHTFDCPVGPGSRRERPYDPNPTARSPAAISVFRNRRRTWGSATAVYVADACEQGGGKGGSLPPDGAPAWWPWPRHPSGCRTQPSNPLMPRSPIDELASEANTLNLRLPFPHALPVRNLPPLSSSGPTHRPLTKYSSVSTPQSQHCHATCADAASAIAGKPLLRRAYAAFKTSPRLPRNGPQRAPRPTAQRVWRTARGDGTSSHRRSPAPPLRRRERRRPDVTLWAHEATA